MDPVIGAAAIGGVFNLASSFIGGGKQQQQQQQPYKDPNAD